MEPKFRFLISGTDTGVGKTTVACGLAAAFKVRGLRVGVMKPAETGCDSRDGELVALDAMALRSAAESSAPLELICPYRYAAPLAPAAAADLEHRAAPDLRHVGRAYERLAAGADVMLVEGAGGIAVPITWRENYADLALRLGLEVVLVVGNRLGCLNATILSVHYAKARNLNLRGYVLNDIEPAATAAAKTNAESLKRLIDVPYLGRIGHQQPVDAATLASLLG